MARKLIPFSMLPASWGLKGESREIAKAEYELEGYELALKLNSIRYTGNDLTRKNLGLNLFHSKISEYEYDVEIAKLDLAGDELKAELLSIDYEHGKIKEREYDFAIAELRDDVLTLLAVQRKYNLITEKAYEKAVKTHRGEPYIDVLEIVVDEKNPSTGDFKLDWNDVFLEMIESAGYVAPKPEESVELWFTEVCKNVALEELAGTGVFDDDVEESAQLKRTRINGKTTIR